ncbi:MAG: hypothetical protein Kow0088_01420 [Anaerolineales bacterium]
MSAIRIPQSRQDKPFVVEVDGQEVIAYEGETVATVLQSAGIRVFFHSEPPYPPSRIFCGMGTCRQCLITVDDQVSCLACRTYVYPGMKIRTSI